MVNKKDKEPSIEGSESSIRERWQAKTGQSLPSFEQFCILFTNMELKRAEDAKRTIKKAKKHYIKILNDLTHFSKSDNFIEMIKEYMEKYPEYRRAYDHFTNVDILRELNAMESKDAKDKVTSDTPVSKTK